MSGSATLHECPSKHWVERRGSVMQCLVRSNPLLGGPSKMVPQRTVPWHPLAGLRSVARSGLGRSAYPELRRAEDPHPAQTQRRRTAAWLKGAALGGGSHPHSEVGARAPSAEFPLGQHLLAEETRQKRKRTPQPCLSRWIAAKRRRHGVGTGPRGSPRRTGCHPVALPGKAHGRRRDPPMQHGGNATTVQCMRHGYADRHRSEGSRHA